MDTKITAPALPRLKMSSEIINSLATEFRRTPQHVRNSLRFFSNTPDSKAIRQRAIEIQREQLADNEHTLKLYSHIAL